MSNQYYFFGTRTTFIKAVPKIFCRVNGASVSKKTLCLHSLHFNMSKLKQNAREKCAILTLK